MKFIPKPAWATELTDEEERILEAVPCLGSPPETAPRIDARLIPADGGYRVSAKTLVDTVSHMQQLVHYAGYDACFGPNPNFADLRALRPEVLTVARLTIEPFAEGSFVIPTRLESEAVSFATEDGRRQVTAESVAHRFNEILEHVGHRSLASDVSAGAIQAIESFGAVLRREIAAIEFSSYDGKGEGKLAPRVIDANFLTRAMRVKQERQIVYDETETLEGKVTALDIHEGKLQLSVDGQRRRVRGTFDMMFLPSLMEILGQRMRLTGYVQWKSGAPATIRILTAQTLAEDE